MVLPLASRFAVLSVDDDDEDRVKRNPKIQNKKKTEQNKASANQSKQKQDPKKKKKPDQNNQQIQNQNQQNKNKNKSSGSQRKKKGASDEQWELWKEKDAELLDGNFESELHQAILLSKLDFEEKKDVYEQLRKEQELEKKTVAKKKKGNKAQTTMSLSEFNSLPDSLVKQPEGGGGGDADVNVNGQPESDPEFFERIQKDAKKAFSNEKAAEKRKAREPFVNDAITIAQYEDQIERRDKQILELKKEISRLNNEMRDVKTRNKTLYDILGQGEMKDKAEVLVQMESTQKVKDELSNEVERLHILLEQERSKVRALTGDNKAKGKKQKRTGNEDQ